MSIGHITLKDEAVTRSGLRIVQLPLRDGHCLRCDGSDEEPYTHTLGTEQGVERWLCWDCAPSEWQHEVIAWEHTILEGDRLLG
jgi:hypothetical protein